MYLKTNECLLRQGVPTGNIWLRTIKNSMMSHSSRLFLSCRITPEDRVSTYISYDSVTPTGHAERPNIR